MAEGVAFGRKPKLTDHQRQKAIARHKAGETTLDRPQLLRPSFHDQPSGGLTVARRFRNFRDRICNSEKSGLEDQPSSPAAIESLFLPVCPQTTKSKSGPRLKPKARGVAARDFQQEAETFLYIFAYLSLVRSHPPPAAHENRGPRHPRGGRTLCPALVSETKPRKRECDGT